jgi:pimeloyl-ACP methyl ester carboxylesterase
MRRDGPVAQMTAGGIPIRIVWCARDRVIPFRRCGEPFVERIHGAEITVMPDVGHLPIYDDPELVADLILGVTGPVDSLREIAK